ncbi:hypothetical protein EDD21DRAFT_45963 [Dissophora ornata]|nr:hypothetical protein EDD21DRAFT_45963 [Dissophora ornata]
MVVECVPFLGPFFSLPSARNLFFWSFLSFLPSLFGFRCSLSPRDPRDPLPPLIRSSLSFSSSALRIADVDESLCMLLNHIAHVKHNQPSRVMSMQTEPVLGKHIVKVASANQDRKKGSTRRRLLQPFSVMTSHAYFCGHYR